MRKIHANEIHTKHSHPREDRMSETAKQITYSVKRKKDVCEDCPAEKSKQKLLHKVAKERNLNMCKMTYLDLAHKINQFMEAPIIESS